MKKTRLEQKLKYFRKKTEEARNRFKDSESQKKANKELYIHYKELFESAVSELHFANLQREQLLSIIDEVHTLSKEEIIKAIIENGKNRHELDKIIHAKTLLIKSSLDNS